jgi:hypothetical protein
MRSNAQGCCRSRPVTTQFHPRRAPGHDRSYVASEIEEAGVVSLDGCLQAEERRRGRELGAQSAHPTPGLDRAGGHEIAERVDAELAQLVCDYAQTVGYAPLR